MTLQILVVKLQKATLTTKEQWEKIRMCNQDLHILLLNDQGPISASLYSSALISDKASRFTLCLTSSSVKQSVTLFPPHIMSVLPGSQCKFMPFYLTRQQKSHVSVAQKAKSYNSKY